MRFRTPSPLGLPLFDGGFHSRWISYNQQRIASILFGLSFTFFIWVILPHLKQSVATHASPLIPSLKSYHYDKSIANGTLGFQEIFAIGLGDRSDRRDSFQLAADVTNIKFTWVDGVAPGKMNPKSIPPAYKLDFVLPGVVGCWRSHMNVIRKIVNERITSALIFEDDADWDLRIVEQMYQFSAATKTLLANGGQKNQPRTKSPYGEGWDILWLGHCGGFHGNLSSVPQHIIRNDVTVPPAYAMDDMLFGLNPYGDGHWKKDSSDPPCAAHAGRDPPGKTCDYPRLGPTDRIVQERAKPVCTAAYAISYQGARKLLARVGGLALNDAFAPVDQGFGDVCAGWTDLPGERTRCFTPSPPYFRGYKSKGLALADSDIRKTGSNGEKRTVGWSKGIMQSARLNVNNIISGVDFTPEEQYVRDGPHGTGEWRLRRDYEYRSYKPDVNVEKWIW